MQIALTWAQYQAIPRLLSSHRPSDVAAIKTIALDERPTHVRVTFDAGWGTTSYDIAPDGDSAHVAFGESEISADA